MPACVWWTGESKKNKQSPVLVSSKQDQHVEAASYVNEQDVRASLKQFESAIDMGCSRCQIGTQTPSFLLSSLNKKRLALCPYMYYFQRHREKSLQALVKPPSVQFMNELLDEYYNAVNDCCAQTDDEKELIFLNLINRKNIKCLSHTKQTAIGFVYCWIFHF